HERLGHAGHALEQHVAADEQRRDQPGHGAVLADDDLGDLLADGEHGGARVAAGFGGFGGNGQRRTSWWMRETAWATATSSDSDPTGRWSTAASTAASSTGEAAATDAARAS